MLPNGITRAIARAALQAKKQSPHIFFGLGVAGVVSGGVMACKATLKVEDELDRVKKNLDVVKEAKKERLPVITDSVASDIGSDEYYHRLTIKTYVYGGLRLGRLYAPAIALTGAGIACLVGSHLQLTRRNAALQTTLVAVQTAYNEYRERVREEIGEERENAIYRNVADMAEEDAIKGRDPMKHSPYAKVFDRSNPEWRDDPELNRAKIQASQNYANHLLLARGHVFLNEVYDVLGFEHTRAGSVVGWVLGNGYGNEIDFGLMEYRNAAFLNGNESVVWLDFNVDGTIFDLI